MVCHCDKRNLESGGIPHSAPRLGPCWCAFSLLWEALLVFALLKANKCLQVGGSGVFQKGMVGIDLLSYSLASCLVMLEVDTSFIHLAICLLLKLDNLSTSCPTQLCRYCIHELTIYPIQPPFNINHILTLNARQDEI